MSKHHSHHHRKIGPAPKSAAGRLPKNKFGALSGVLDHLTLAAHDGSHADDNHVYIWLKVPFGSLAGKYECAFNTESSDGAAASQYAVAEEAIELTDFPDDGFADASVSYAGLGLSQADFQDIENGSLRSAIYDWAGSASIITAYGVTYKDGTGLHEIHMNSGEPAGSKFPNLVNEDGALVFYYKPEGEQSFRRWVFIKFSSQNV